jgi:DNA-binding winged helix-turn-helix (wHTH) protein
MQKDVKKTVRQRGYKAIKNVKIMDKNRKKNIFINKRVEKPKNECTKRQLTQKSKLINRQHNTEY